MEAIDAEINGCSGRIIDWQNNQYEVSSQQQKRVEREVVGKEKSRFKKFVSDPLFIGVAFLTIAIILGIVLKHVI